MNVKTLRMKAQSVGGDGCSALGSLMFQMRLCMRVAERGGVHEISSIPMLCDSLMRRPIVSPLAHCHVNAQNATKWMAFIALLGNYIWTPNLDLLVLTFGWLALSSLYWVAIVSCCRKIILYSFGAYSLFLYWLELYIYFWKVDM